MTSDENGVDVSEKLAELEPFDKLARPHSAHLGKTPSESLREKLT